MTILNAQPVVRWTDAATLQARIVTLEQELAAAQSTIERLTGRLQLWERLAVWGTGRRDYGMGPRSRRAPQSIGRCRRRRNGDGDLAT